MTTTFERHAVAHHLAGQAARQANDLDGTVSAIRSREGYVKHIAHLTGETTGVVRARILLIARSVSAGAPSKSNPYAA